MTNATAKKPVATKTPKVVNKTPKAKAPAKPALKVVNKTPKPSAAKAPVKAKEPEKRGVGKPISPEAVKVRRRTVALFKKQIDANPLDVEVTVKSVTKTLKLKKVTVSNTIRWAESKGLIKRMGYKLNTGPGRKEVFYALQNDVLQNLDDLK